ncbi:hypothetical protein LWF01_16420 [Saxibacter everestensis]|uniref:Thioredoxin-like fold domain-containing protein n=1 Tax=Saxibacter everestensis TaxID=2909229 RepID=A0ABY8QTA0_9MICO|nr:hypothetical protein LWF01_16420 [Brevibacteriaceae bacterium ZFBP1038]
MRATVRDELVSSERSLKDATRAVPTVTIDRKITGLSNVTLSADVVDELLQLDGVIALATE